MHIPVERYLAMLQKELATSLMPEDDNAKRIATYSQRVLNQLVARFNTLPALELKAIQDLGGLLDELNAHLRSIDGAMVLTGTLTWYIRNDPDFEKLEPALQKVTSVLIANPSDKSRSLLQRIVTILAAKEAALDKVTREQELSHQSQDKKAEVPPLDDKQKRALHNYLKTKFDEPTIELGAIKAITGGGSKKTLIIKLLNARKLPATIVLRADHFGGVVESTVVDEYQLIQTLYEGGLPVPQPYIAEPDPSIIGAAFVLLGLLEGENNGDHISIYEPSRTFGLDLATAIGKLHSIPPEKFGNKIRGATMTTRELVLQEMRTFETTWRGSDQASVVLEMGYAWLKDHIHFVDGARALNHCDLACHNWLAKDGRLTAILDWETTVISNPAHDLAYLYHLVIQMMPWEDFIAQYEKAGGKAPAQQEFDFFLLWTGIWRITFLFVARSFFHSGMSESVVLAYGTQHLWQRANCELHKTMARIAERY